MNIYGHHRTIHEVLNGLKTIFPYCNDYYQALDHYKTYYLQ